MKNKKEKGFSLLEMILVVAILGILAAIVFPNAYRIYYASDFNTEVISMLSEMRAIRFTAMAQSNYIGIIFYNVASKWYYIVVKDGNDNGIRIKDISDGIDKIMKGPIECISNSKTAEVGILDSNIPQIPPEQGYLDINDPIKFGKSDIFSCSNIGTCSSGTIYFSSKQLKEMKAIRVFGPTAKFTLWSYNSEIGWSKIKD